MAENKRRDPRLILGGVFIALGAVFLATGQSGVGLVMFAVGIAMIGASRVAARKAAALKDSSTTAKPADKGHDQSEGAE